MSPGSTPLLLWTDDTLCDGVRDLLRRRPKDHLVEYRHTGQRRSQSVYKSRKNGPLDHSDGMERKGNAKRREMKRAIKWFSCYSCCCCVFGLCAGFVGCLQPVHRDKVVQRNGSQ